MNYNSTRVQELVAGMHSFGKESYQKSERLNEMLSLQDEMVALTFNEDHAALADLKIWDVERHLDQLNRDCGSVADEEIQRFRDGAKVFCNLIKAEISGNRGEAKAFRSLQRIHTKNIVLRNVELSDGDLRTELDAVVITPASVTIVEVKNTSRNVYIDDRGDFYKTGEFLRLDCNIAEKMDRKEELLRRVLSSGNMEEVQIKSILVFTNNKIEIQNRYPELRMCFLSQLPVIIDGLKNDKLLTEDEMSDIERFIKAAENKESYPLDFDVSQFKMDFATVMAILEEASSEAVDYKTDRVLIESETKADETSVKKSRVSNYLGYVGCAVAASVVTVLSMIAISAFKKGGEK